MPRPRQVDKQRSKSAIEIDEPSWHKQVEPIPTENLFAPPSSQGQKIVVAVRKVRVAIKHDRDELDIAQHAAQAALGFAQITFQCLQTAAFFRFFHRSFHGGGQAEQIAFQYVVGCPAFQRIYGIFFAYQSRNKYKWDI